MIKNCLVCGEEFKTYPSRVKIGRGKYCSKECSYQVTLIKKGTKPHNYKGWRLHQARKNGKKYKEIYKPEHPFASKAGYVREHRLVMEEVLGRYLKPDEVVDHINADQTLNNHPGNLRVMKKREHDRMNTPLNIHRRWVERANG